EVNPGDPTGREVILHPREAWKSFKVYTLTVSDEVKDLAGRPLAAEYRATFLAQEDATAPALLAAEATANDPGAAPPFSGPGSDVTSTAYELLPEDVFRFTFSEAMDREATESALSFSPSLPGTSFWPSESVFVHVPDTPLGPGVDYTLILAATATDRSGIPLSNPLSLQIATTHEWLSLSVEFVEDGVTLVSSQEDSATRIQPGLSPDFAYNIAITFSEPFETDGDKLALRQAIRLSTLLSNDATPPYAVGYSWPTNRQIRLTYHNVLPSTETDTNYLLFSVPGGATGIASSGGNQLEQDLRILLRPEADR
ncbi:MAG: Ig-like domain-containing protein, partial [Spirochaetota bacterium]